MVMYVKWQDVGMWGQCGAGCLWTGDKRREKSSCVFREKHSKRGGRTQYMYANQQPIAHGTCLNLHALSLK